jgi:Ca2+-binding RTX toxin-like protein
MYCEILESRSLLSATLSPTGVLTISGGDTNDHIDVFLTNKTTLRVREVSILPAVQTGQKPTVTRDHTDFALADVKSIVVNAGSGNDVVDVGGTRRHALKIASTIDGGDGNDRLLGGNANDVITGGAGNDYIVGRAGNDNLDGGDGRDHLIGGQGSDTLTGDAGNDFIDAFDHSGTDHVDGGANDAPTTTQPGDRALVDKGDVVTNVENVKTIAPRAHPLRMRVA